MRNCVLISPTDSKLIDSLRNVGIDTISTKPLENVYDNEKYHADMQCLIINKTAFIPLECCEIADQISRYVDSVRFCENPQRKYPNNIGLNALLVGNYLFCKESALEDKVKASCKDLGVRIINVNQGYARCSTLSLGMKGIITADTTICAAAMQNGIDVLKISEGNIILEEVDYGFIGGASGVIGDTVVFFGDIHTHPDCAQIIDFIKERGFSYLCLGDDYLHDIGGFVLLD